MRGISMDLVALRRSFMVLVSLALLLSAVRIHSTLVSVAYSPHQGDFFKYNETTDLGSGTGSYAGYTEQQTVIGGDNVTGVNGNVVSMNYSYAYHWSNSSGTSLTGSNKGPYTFSDISFLYVSGTDNQTSFGGVKYVNPAVWFAMNNSLPEGANFTILNTPMKIISSSTTFFLPTENVMVNAIFAKGSGSYQRNDVYGQFSASYVWSAWYDPVTGYIIGYNYVEQDTNPDGDGFNYTDNLYVSASSYQLSVASSITTTNTISSAPSSSTAASSTSSSNASTFGNVTSPQTSQTPWLDYILVIALVVVIVAIVAFEFIRRRGSPST